MTHSKQDHIDDAINFISKTQNGIRAEVNQQNTVIKAETKEDIAQFLGVDITHHTVFTGQKKRERYVEFPLLYLTMEGLDLAPPDRIYYKHHRILISVHSDVVLGIVPIV